MFGKSSREAPPPPTISAPRRYRCWPIYSAAFTRTFSYTIYSLALPNYLIYFNHFPADLLGLVISIYAITYIAGPVVALPVTRIIGAKNGAVLSVIGSLFLVFFQLVFTDPLPLIVLRALDGFILGFFWPNLQMEVSNWQAAVPERASGSFFQAYGMSWNLGILLGNITGYFIVLFGHGNEFLALVISWFMMIAMLPCVLSMEGSGTGMVLEGSSLVASSNPARTHGSKLLSVQDKQESLEKPWPPTTRYLLAFPATFYLLGTLIYAYMKAFYPFVYPITLNDAGIPSHVVYLVTFFHQGLQTIIVLAWTKKHPRPQYFAWFGAMLASAGFLILLLAIETPLLLTIAFVTNGILSGWLYVFTSKLMLEYGAAKNSLKHTTYYEFFNGIGFGIAPLLTGGLLVIGKVANYAITSIIFISCTVVLFWLSAAARKKARLLNGAMNK